MLRILQFIYRIRAFLLFIFLEVVATWLIVSNNSPQGAAFLNSSSHLVGSILEIQSNVSHFFSLAQANEELVEENAKIFQSLAQSQIKADSLHIPLDSTMESTFEFRSARVVGNSLRYSQNHLTLNKGAKNGIKPGMGIFDSRGVIGRVKAVSDNYSVAYSMLNTSLLISSKIKSTNDFGSVQWDGAKPGEAKLLYVPRHVKTQPGDTIITSGFNAVFPEGIPIGVISEVNPDEDNSNYLNIRLKLCVDFSKITYVYLVENTKFTQLDSLYKKAEVINEY